MNLTKALALWEKLGNTTNGYDDENNNYVIDFLNKDNDVVGWFKAYPGQGFGWSYPDELFNTTR